MTENSCIIHNVRRAKAHRTERQVNKMRKDDQMPHRDDQAIMEMAIIIMETVKDDEERIKLMRRIQRILEKGATANADQAEQ